jgi:hypothetical protein
MIWTPDITSNRQTLLGIVAALLAMVGLGDRLRLEVLRTLRPAEAAVRRLIVMAARGLVLKPTVSRPMPPGLAKQLHLKRKERTVRPVFPLADQLIPMVDPVPKKYFRQSPRISSFAPLDPTITAIFQAHAAKTFAPPPSIEPANSALPIIRRLEALQLALDDLPRQARRLVRWRVRRNAIAALRPIATSPLRPGRAPYLPKIPVRDIDYVLERCHLLARDALHADTS